MITAAAIDGTPIHDAATRFLTRDSVQALVLGKPEPRQNIVERQSDDGTIDLTRFYEDRAVTLAGKSRVDWAGFAGERDALANLFDLHANDGLHTLQVTFADGSVKSILFRVESAWDAEPIGASSHFRWKVDIRASDPRWYGTARTLTYNPTGTPTTGFTFPVVFPLSFEGDGGALPTFVSEGRSSTPSLITVTGPWVNPWLENVSTGVGVYTRGVSLAATDVLVVDTNAKAVSLNGTRDDNLVDWLRSRWMYLRSGGNALRAGGTFASGATLAVTASDAWI